MHYTQKNLVDAFQKKSSPGTLISIKMESQITLKSLGAIRPICLTSDSQHRLRSPMQRLTTG
jgi:hypothetical protein